MVCSNVVCSSMNWISLYNNILEPSKIVIGSNYHLFKAGIRPMWEDAGNVKGGKWIYTSPKQKRGKLDECWMHTVGFFHRMERILLTWCIVAGDDWRVHGG